MKVTVNNMQIECTVDEFEEMIARGILEKKNSSSIAGAGKYEIPKATTFKPYDVVALYGCRVLGPDANTDFSTTSLSYTAGVSSEVVENILKEQKKESK